MTKPDRNTLERLLKDQEVSDPPADLLDRIKNEIPATLPGATTPLRPAERPWWALRVAASVFVLLGAGFLFFRTDSSKYEVVEKRSAPSLRSKEMRQDAPATVPSAGSDDATILIPTEPTAEAKTTETDAIRYRDGVPMPGVAVAAPASRRFEEAASVVELESAVSGDASSEVPLVAEQTVSAPAPKAPPPPPAPALIGGVTGGVRTRAPARRSLAKAEGAQRPPTVPTAAPVAAAANADMAYAGANPYIDPNVEPVSTFALVVGDRSYQIARDFLNDGRLPPPASIRPEEFLNHFDYRDVPPFGRDFAIRGEGAASPFPPGEHYSVLRFGIRAREQASPPIEDASVEVRFNRATVAHYRLVGNESVGVTPGPDPLPAAHTVSALYEVKLAPGVRRGQEVATLTLRYQIAGADRRAQQTHTVSVGEIARDWESAPPSLQLATIVAAFAEVLQDRYWARTISLEELAARAEAVALQFNGDERVAGLAGLIRLTAELRVPAQNGD